MSPGAAAEESTSTKRRRVRTGCLTCRKKRRKCDEVKPTCTRCLEQGASCQYGARFTFVSISSSGEGRSRNEDLRTRLAPEETTTTTTPGNADEELLLDAPVTTPGVLVPDNINTEEGSPATALVTSEAQVDRRSSPIPLPESEIPTSYDFNSSGNDIPGNQRPLAPVLTQYCNDGTSVSDSRTPSHNSTFFAIIDNPSTSGEATNYASFLSGRKRQANSAINSHCQGRVLKDSNITWLCVFRYDVARWLDLGLSPAYWGVIVMERSSHDPALLSAVLAIARHVSERLPPSSSVISPPRMQTMSPSSADFWLVSDVLSALELMVRAPTSDWSAGLRSHALGHIVQAAHISVQQLWNRMVLSALLLDGPLRPESFEDFSSPSSSVPDSHQSSRVTKTFQQSMAHLWDSMRYCVLPHGNQPSDLDSDDGWLLCFTRVQSWYLQRVEEMRPLLDVSEIINDHSQIGSTGTFPPVIFSTMAAAVANTAYHTAMLLLLRCKPVALKVRNVSRGALAPTWHALRIISIASGAAQDGFWDPLMVAATIRASSLLSHTSQLHAVSNTLRNFCELCPIQIDPHLKSIESRIAMLNSDF